MNREKADLFYFALVGAVCVSLCLGGCATQGKSVGLGGAIGAGSGAVLGGIADPGRNGAYRTRNVILGAAIGGVAGMVAGDMVYKKSEKDKKEAFLKGQASAPAREGGAAPTLNPARVESKWIDGHAVGTNRWVEGHFEYIIVEPARWSD